MMTRHETLAVEDAARLHMSGTDDPMLITALVLLDRPIEFDELVLRLESRISKHLRFRQLVVEPRFGLSMPHWREDRTFDVRHHVHHIDMALMPGTPRLDEVIGSLSTIPLARRRPLWRMHLIDGRQPAIMVLVHHALADASMLLSLLRDLIDEKTPAPDGELDQTTSVRGRARHVTRGMLAAVRLALRRADPLTPLKVPARERKQLTFSSPLPLDELRSVAHALQTTVTGLLLVATTGACRAELSRTKFAEDLVLHAFVPMSLGVRRGLGNHYGSAIVPLPVGTLDLAARVHEVREKAARELHSHRAGVRGARLAAAAGALSASVERAFVQFFSRKASVVVSSVRGPRVPVHLCGALVRDIVAWAPSPGTITLSITLTSYAGQVRIGVAERASDVESARRLVVELEREIASVGTFASAARA